jgi:RNA recognition motif-containing protein
MRSSFYQSTGFYEIIMNIYIGNLPYSVTEDDLRNAFNEFGQVDSANIIIDKFSGRSKGFGFVEMPNDEEAERAIDSLNDTDLNGRTIKVNQARPREERPARRDRY